MAASYSFRSALNGFNREDVVRHIEYINTKHANQVNQLKSDLELAERQAAELRKLQGVQEQLAQLQDHCAALEQEKADQAQQIDILLQELTEAKRQKAQVASRTEEELEAYRRAERIERQAQQRAEQLCQKANGVLADASVKADESARRISAMADQVAGQLAVLQQEVIASKAALQEAALSIAALQPEEN